MYLFGDHLGSTSVAVNPDGSLLSKQLYKAWGEVRYTSGTLPTKYTYTGQYSNVSEFGLLFYNARYYDPLLARFTQADTLIPNPGNPLDWDRFSYARNNALMYVDPSGHDPECGPDGIWCSNNWQEAYGISFEGGWTERNKSVVELAVEAVGSEFAKTLGWDNPVRAFTVVFRTYKRMMALAWVNEFIGDDGKTIYYGGAQAISASRIVFASLSQAGGERTPMMALIDARNNVVHELGHAFASLWYRKDGKYDDSGPYGTFAPINKDYQNNDGFAGSPISARRTWRQHPCEYPDFVCRHEVYADQFLAWTFGRWGTGLVRDWRRDYMITNMAYWLR